MTRLSRLMIPLLFALPLSAAFAIHENIPGDLAEDRAEWCSTHAEQCEKMKAHRKEFCEKNPVTCQREEAVREDQRNWCKGNTVECNKLKEERHAQHEEMRKKMQERCAKNKEKCEELKARFHRNHPNAAEQSKP